MDLVKNEQQSEFTTANIKKLLLLADKQRFNNGFNKQNNFQSSFFNPYRGNYSTYQNLKVVDRTLNGDIACSTLRRVSQKAFVINICINHILMKITPFIKPSTNQNTRGYVIKEKGQDVAIQLSKKSKKKTEIENFLQNCGTDFDSDRDNFLRYCLKIVRDIMELDQVATEIGYTKGGKPCAFQAIDAATVNKVVPGQDNPNKIKYIQIIDGIQQAFYTDANIVFDYKNPRSDIEHSYYGYSVVDQAIDLVTSQINTFMYNAGFFIENKLPRGMLLIDGNVSQTNMDKITEYIDDLMSGSTSAQWRIPVIPSGGEGDNASNIKWVSLAGSSKEMEFQQFLDYQTSCIVALFGCSMEELGLQSAKSQNLFENSQTGKIQESKSLTLGNILSFLQNYLNKVISRFYPDYEIEFVGYEKDDPNSVADLDKKKLESYMVLNEVRVEKGLPKIEADWADKCPANPQFTQMYQASQAQQESNDDEMEDENFNKEEFSDDELEDDSSDDLNNSDDESNKDFEDSKDDESLDENLLEKETKKSLEMKKSLNKNLVMQF